jgi:hypothetical protein
LPHEVQYDHSEEGQIDDDVLDEYGYQRDAGELSVFGGHQARQDILDVESLNRNEEQS